MTAKEFKNINERIENRFLINKFKCLIIEPYAEYCIHPFMYTEGEYFLCIKYRKLIDLMEGISTLKKDDVAKIHYKNIQRINPINKKKKNITYWVKDYTKVITNRKEKIKKLLKENNEHKNI